MVAKLKRIAALLLAMALVCSAIPLASGMVVQAEALDSVTQLEDEGEEEIGEAEEDSAADVTDAQADQEEAAAEEEEFITPDMAGLLDEVEDDTEEERESEVLRIARAATKAVAGKTVVDQDSQWRYLDDNTDPGADTAISGNGMKYGWALVDYFYYNNVFYPLTAMGGEPFDDSSWSVGKGPFGFDFSGSLSVNTALTANTDGSDDEDGTRVPAYFFRTTFELTEADLAEINSIYYDLCYNDAVIIYINGRSVEGVFNTPVKGYSSNLSYGALDKIEDGYIQEDGLISAENYLVEGKNVLAVEVHQADAASEDIYFDFQQLTLCEEEAEEVLEDIKALSVSVGSDETELGFTWYSNSQEDAKLRISTSKNSSVFKEYDAATTAAQTASGYYSNKVTVTDLKADTTYYYSVGNGSEWTLKYQIKTGNSEAFTFLLAGDPQIGASGNIRADNYGWIQMIQKVQATFPETSFLVSAGDQVETASNESHYDSYLIEELANMPVATTIGNHDDGANYSEHFNVPNESTLGATNAGGDYWFTYGDALFMMINAQNVSAAEHHEFMEAAIAANPDANWTIAVFHQSVYSAASHSKTDVILDWRKVMVPVIDELEIDIVLMGHDHSYTRTYQMYNFEVAEVLTQAGEQASTNVTDPEGTLYVTANSASGSKFYGLQEEYEYQAVRNQSEQASITKIDMTADTFKMVTYLLDEDTNDLVILDNYSITKTAAGAQDPGDEEEDEPVATPEDTKDDDTTVTKTSATNKTSSATNPKTGDENSFLTWILLMAAVGCVMTGMIVYKKRFRGINN